MGAHVISSERLPVGARVFPELRDFGGRVISQGRVISRGGNPYFPLVRELRWETRDFPINCGDFE